MVEQNQNAFRVESQGDPASGSLADTPFAELEYNSATGTFIPRRCALAADPAEPAVPAEPAEPAAPPPPVDPPPPPPPERAAATGALIGPIDLDDDAPEPVPFSRARLDGWTPARQRQFLEELADCGIVKEAAARVGMSRQSAWQLRRRAEGTPFAFVFEAALQTGARRLKSIAFARAVEGMARPVFYRGEKVGERIYYDNRLLLALIAKIPAGAAARNIPRVLANWEGWLDAVEQGRAEPPPSIADADTAESPVWRDEDGGWWTGFPAPEGFDGIEEGDWQEGDYRRTLTEEERAVLEAEDDGAVARSAADRDAFFAAPK